MLASACWLVRQQSFFACISTQYQRNLVIAVLLDSLALSASLKESVLQLVRYGTKCTTASTTISNTLSKCRSRWTGVPCRPHPVQARDALCQHAF